MSAKKTTAKKTEAKNSFNIIIYRTELCPYCHMAEEFLKANDIKYKSIDVGANPKAAQEMFKKSGQMGVPVIDINGKIVIGYDKSALKRILGIN